MPPPRHHSALGRKRYHEHLRDEMRVGKALGLHPIRTCKEVGAILGMSHTMVEIIEGVALAKIARRLRQEGGL
jgi:hypothetical protein